MHRKPVCSFSLPHHPHHKSSPFSNAPPTLLTSDLKYQIFILYLSYHQLIITMKKIIPLLLLFLYVFSLSSVCFSANVTYLWPLPAEFTSGNVTLSVDPSLSLVVGGIGGGSHMIREGFNRYKRIIFNSVSGRMMVTMMQNKKKGSYDISQVRVVVKYVDENLNLGVDESYNLYVLKRDGKATVGEALIEANTVYGALRALETFSQLCTFNYETKSMQVHNAPWNIRDKPRFAYRGLLLDTSRHYYPIDVIKQVIESMSYAKLNVLHWHIIDKESFPLEVPTFPKLWKGSYSQWERYTVEDAYEVVNFAKNRGINVMAEVDVPGHAESWGTGYPDLWPSSSCTQPLDVSKNFTFDVLSGILTDLRKIFPFELFHLGGDEVDTTCWYETPHVMKWLEQRNMSAKEAYQYFVLKAQEIAISKNWSPVNWEETFDNFPTKLNPKTVVHNWLGGGVCPKAVDQGFRCIFSNQDVWYLDHLDVPWDVLYNADPLEGIDDPSKQKLVLGGEVCMWGETADTSDVQQTIWPRAAAAAERLWSTKESTTGKASNETALPRLHYFRCLLNRRGVQAAPVENFSARTAPNGAGSCYVQ